MAGQMEKIALGELALRGRVELEITDPLTGRPYYRFEDHNIVLDNLYQYLKTLCIAALCSYDGLYGYHPNTAFSGASYNLGGPVSNYYGLCFGLSSYSAQGNSSYPPSTANKTALKCPVEAVSLTDGRAQPSGSDVRIDGSVIATADLRTQVASGGTGGIFTYSKSYENFRKLYRRWDWASANGNGELSKIYLHTIETTLPPFLFHKSISSLSLPVPSVNSWMTVGQVRNHIFFCTEINNGVASFAVLTVDVGTAAATIKTFVVDPTALGSSIKPTSRIFCILETKEPDVIKIISNNVSDYYTLPVYSYNLTTGEVGLKEYQGFHDYPNDPTRPDRLYNSIGQTSFEYRNIFAAYRDTDGLITLFSGYNYRIYKIPETGNVLQYFSSYRNVGNNSGLLFNNSGYRRPNENYVELLKGDYVYQFNKATGENTSNTPYWQYGFWYNFEGSKYVLGGLGDGLLYLCSIYWSATIPYIQVDAVREDDVGLRIMTERLLPEPVVKDNMPMYVGYTLEFE